MNFQSINRYIGFGKDVTQALLDFGSRRLSSTTQAAFGLKVINEAVGAKVDICLVHGINGDWKSTWTSDGTFWPQDLLPKDKNMPCPARVLSYAYNTKFPTSEYLTTRTLYHQAIELVEALCNIRVGEAKNTRPIIFVGHELGGMVVQSAFILSSASGDERLRSVCLSATGIVFLGTPYRGIGDEEWISSVCKIVADSPSGKESDLTTIRDDATLLKNMLQPFVAVTSVIPVRGISPSELQTCHSVKGYSVRRSQKVLSDMGRFAFREEKGYKGLVEVLASLCQNCESLCRENWTRFNSDHGGMHAIEGISKDFFKINPDLPARNPNFVGRALQLNVLGQKIFAKTPGTEVSSMIIVSGPPGIGKSQFVFQYAHTRQSEFSSLFWIFAESARAIEMGYYSIAQKLLEHYTRIIEKSGLSNGDARVKAATALGLQDLIDSIPKEQTRLGITKIRTVTRAVIEWFNRKENDGWLLILDAVDLENLMDVFHLIPMNRHNHGHVVVTRRQDITSSAIRHIPLHGLNFKYARSLLLKLTGKVPEDAVEDAQIIKILDSCEGNPLGIVRVASRIHSTGVTLQQYADTFIGSNVGDVILNVNDVSSTNSPSVAHHWDSIVSQLKPRERQLLNCCCSFSGEAIPWEVFAACPDVFGTSNVTELEAAMDELEKQKLISRNHNCRYVTANDILAQWQVDRLDPKERAAATRNSWRCMASFAKASSPEAGDGVLNSLIQKSVVDLITNSPTHVENDPWQSQLSAQELVHLAELCRRRGQYDTADQFGEHAYQKLEKGETSRVTYKRLLHIFLESSDTSKAEKVWNVDPSLWGDQSTKGTTEDSARNFLKIRFLYVSRRFDEAIEQARLFIVQLEDQEGPNDSITLSTLQVLQALLLEKSEFEMAAPVVQRLIFSYEILYGPDDSLVTESLETLGYIYLVLGRLDDACRIYMRAQKQHQQRLGMEHPTTQLSVVKLATVYSRQKRYDDASQLYIDVLKHMEAWFGPRHPDVILIRNCRAENYKKQGDLEGARKNFSDNLEAFKSWEEISAGSTIKSKTKPRTVAIQLRSVLVQMGRASEAEDIASAYNLS